MYWMVNLVNCRQRFRSIIEPLINATAHGNQIRYQLKIILDNA
ncbi:hypothetical protein SAMN05216475_5086 [Pseudomonas synxantha]|uniref:Mobile element protein n=1 Tax=Pseudomonas synxantha TaxID=47883 RepID=A0AAX3IE74_9PSED|nr:hypothetical protein C4K01_5304 [Pseudomonas synxantha]MDQ0977420.1 hypothetical protein [Pseudomonas synxantha]SDU59504.1 hypothetical protein SAMN05216475_5086 [Pseudomonas synxantha]VTR05159.1 Uncharacterised protein [Pseudomonas synxantha]